MNIKIITVGKLKEKYLRDGVQEYVKRLGAYAHVDLIEVPDEKIPNNPSLAEETLVKSKEGRKILDHVKQNDFMILLDVASREMDSVAFSQYIVDGYLQKHLRKLVREYREKHLYLKKLLDTYLCVSYILDETYMAYWIKLDVDMEKFKSLCESNLMGVSYSSSGIGLSFASMDKELMKDGVIRLAELVKEC